MTLTPATYARRYRDRKRGGPPRTPQPCGTRAAATRHRRRGEPLCDACIAAERAYMRDAKKGINAKRPPHVARGETRDDARRPALPRGEAAPDACELCGVGHHEEVPGPDTAPQPGKRP
jgi:hypothetical protein